MLFHTPCSRHPLKYHNLVHDLFFKSYTRAALRYLHARRALSTSASLARVENVRVTCGGNGDVELSIHNPPSPTSKDPVLIYLPPTPSKSLFPTENTSSTLPSFLSTWKTPIVRVNYRWSSQNPFPTPIHDTTFAYDWIMSKLLPTTSPRRPVGVYGSYLGGTIATSLALTESRIGKRGMISALAVQDTVFDWTMLHREDADVPESAAKTRKQKQKQTRSVEDGEAKRLRELMPSLFRSPEATFDPFASPLLFLRTPGMYVPTSFLSNDPIHDTLPTPPLTPDSSSVTEFPDIWDEPDFPEDFEPASGISVSEMALGPAPRKSHLRFPPRGSGLIIPSTKIAVSGKSAWLHGQGEEMSRLLARSVMVNEGRDRSAYEEVDESEVQDRVQFVQEEGDEGIGAWLRDVLG